MGVGWGMGVWDWGGRNQQAQDERPEVSLLYNTYIHTPHTRGMRRCGAVPGSTVVDCDSPHGFSLCPISFFLHTIHAASPFALSLSSPPACAAPSWGGLHSLPTRMCMSLGASRHHDSAACVSFPLFLFVM